MPDKDGKLCEVDTDYFGVFQENNELYVFHFCGDTDPSKWFREVGVTMFKESSPMCEVCKTPIPEKISAILKIHTSGL